LFNARGIPNFLKENYPRICLLFLITSFIFITTSTSILAWSEQELQLNLYDYSIYNIILQEDTTYSDIWLSLRYAAFLLIPTLIFITSYLLGRAALKVKPIREVITRRERHFKLEPGYSYLVKDEVEKAFEIFVDQVMGGSEGLCITRERPSKIRQQYGLKKTPVVWLRKDKAKNETTVNSLQDLSIMINQFLKKAKHGVVLLDGFEYLVVNNEFTPCIQFLQLARSRFEENDGNFVVPILEDAFEVKDFTILERELKPF
jgi:hypothetical protein